MTRLAGHVLKASDIKLNGRFRLDIVQDSPGRIKDKGLVLPKPQVRITESHPDFAVVEVTCCCGSKTYVRCDYAVSQAPEEQRA